MQDSGRFEEEEVKISGEKREVIRIYLRKHSLAAELGLGWKI
jgi:hypothetical protein